jgi:nucleoside-diphosphate-sugar epimerase
MIFVTGGTGFLGRHLIATLCRAGCEIRVLTRDPSRHPWLRRYPRLEVIQGDLLDRDLLIRASEGCRYVIHAGGLFRFWGDERQFMETNATGTENMLAAVTGSDIERFVHISSVAVIGQPAPNRIIDESHPPQPSDPYQRSKLQGEKIALRYHEQHNVPVVILRPGAFYGPLGEYAFNRLFFKDPMRGIIMQVDGGHYITFPAYIGDVARGILNSLEHARPGDIYHLCGDWLTHKEAFDIVCQEAGLRWPRPPIPGWLGINTALFMEFVARFTRQEPFWPINMRSYVYNNWRVSSEKARRELGFEPISFREGARRTIAWYRSGKPDDLPELECRQ